MSDVSQALLGDIGDTHMCYYFSPFFLIIFNNNGHCAGFFGVYMKSLNVVSGIAGKYYLS